MLADVTTRLVDVQQALVAMLPAEAYLVGHSLENDFAALRLCHRRVLDSSLLYPHPGGGRYRHALRSLTELYLGRRIQTSRDGHDSSEDAIAALDLVKMKLRKGASFGVTAGTRKWNNMFDVLAKTAVTSALVATSGTIAIFAGDSAHALPVNNDEEAVQRALRELRKSEESRRKLIVTQLPEGGKLDDSGGATGIMGLPAGLDRLDTAAAQLFEEMAVGSLLLCVVQPSQATLHKLRAAAESSSGSPEQLRTATATYRAACKRASQATVLLRLKTEAGWS
eukprot:PLAT2048.1.p1 GENE.PLAT2048.1~~PLAT2048.1.p1  ORF type:complete len:321 (-),score=146.48 PLAT2048.1:93-935(-)